MDYFILFVFLFVYLGMILGEIRGLALDRTGIVLLGAIALAAFGRVTPEAAWKAVDVPTIALLFGYMVVSAQFRIGGFYTLVTRKIAAHECAPHWLLAQVIALAGALSAVLANDIVCLAMAPILIEGCVRRRLNPMPFLLALACASNIGSAATLIGNPQNMLIGQVLRLSFSKYLLLAAVPSILGLAAAWAVICARYRARWTCDMPALEGEAPAFDRWQSIKGGMVLAGLMGVFLFAPWPREVSALAAAGVLLMSRRMASRRFLNLVDWQLLVLFIGLFVVNHALEASGMLEAGLRTLRAGGIEPNHGAWLFGLTVALSNLISNVPAVMLLLPSTTHPEAGLILALASTLAGNLFIVGSIANIIVVEQAARLGVRIGWREHAKTGVPVTLITLAISAVWLMLIAARA